VAGACEQTKSRKCCWWIASASALASDYPDRLLAQFSLGILYFTGEGVPKDAVLACSWFNIAAANGNEQARHNLTILERQMTAGQIAEAQRISRDFRPRAR